MELVVKNYITYNSGKKLHQSENCISKLHQNNTLAPVHAHRSLWMMQNWFFLFPLSYRLPADHRVVQGGFSSEGGSGGFDSSTGTFSIATILRDTWTTVGTAEPCNCINTATPGERNITLLPLSALLRITCLKGSLWALMVPWGSFKILWNLAKKVDI